MSEPHQHNVPNEYNRNHNVIDNVQHENNNRVKIENYEESRDTGSEDENENNEGLEDHDSEEEEGITEEETSPTLRRSNRLRTPNPRYQHLTASNVNTEEEYREQTGAMIAIDNVPFQQ